MRGISQKQNNKKRGKRIKFGKSPGHATDTIEDSFHPVYSAGSNVNIGASISHTTPLKTTQKVPAKQSKLLSTTERGLRCQKWICGSYNEGGEVPSLRI
ncbi:hypothetical protein Trydic_g7178 [Trypoxylus dichotomus]